MNPYRSVTNSNIILGMLLAFGLPLFLLLGWVFFSYYELETRSSWIFTAQPYKAPPGCFWSKSIISPQCNTIKYYLVDSGRYGLKKIRHDPGVWIRVNGDAAKVVCVTSWKCIITDYVAGKFSEVTPQERALIIGECVKNKHNLIKLSVNRYADCDMYDDQR